MPHCIFQKLARKNSHIPTKCQVRSLRGTCPSSPSQFPLHVVHHSLLRTVVLQSYVPSTPGEADFRRERTIFQFDKCTNPLGIPSNTKGHANTSCHSMEFNTAVGGARCIGMQELGTEHEAFNAMISMIVLQPLPPLDCRQPEHFHSEFAEVSVMKGYICHAKIGDLYAAMHLLKACLEVLCVQASPFVFQLIISFDFHVQDPLRNNVHWNLSQSSNYF